RKDEVHALNQSEQRWQAQAKVAQGQVRPRTRRIDDGGGADGRRSTTRQVFQVYRGDASVGAVEADGRDVVVDPRTVLGGTSEYLDDQPLWQLSLSVPEKLAALQPVGTE